MLLVHYFQHRSLQRIVSALRACGFSILLLRPRRASEDEKEHFLRTWPLARFGHYLFIEAGATAKC